MNEFKVFWASRNIGNEPSVFNHHFVLIYLPLCYSLHRIPSLLQGVQAFVTLAAFPSRDGSSYYGNLIFRPNDGYDVQAARLFLDATATQTQRRNYDPQQNQVAPPSGTTENFASRLVRMAFNYRANESRRPVTYVNYGPNSNSWVNSIFSAAGVPASNRRGYREFAGYDVGEHMVLPASLFQ